MRSGIGVSLYLPEDMMAWLRAEAVRQERSLSLVVAWWWTQWKRGAGK